MMKTVLHKMILSKVASKDTVPLESQTVVPALLAILTLHRILIELNKKMKDCAWAVFV